MYIWTQPHCNENLQVRSGKTLIQQGDMVGAFKLDIKTVYDTPGNYICLKLSWVYID